jgi:hypothetical protein
MVSEAEIHAFHLSQITNISSVHASSSADKLDPILSDQAMLDFYCNVDKSDSIGPKHNRRSTISEADVHAWHLSHLQRGGLGEGSGVKRARLSLPVKAKSNGSSRLRPIPKPRSAIPHSRPFNSRISLSIKEDDHHRCFIPKEAIFPKIQQTTHGSSRLPSPSPSPPPQTLPSPPRDYTVGFQADHHVNEYESDHEIDQLPSSSMPPSQRSEHTIRANRRGSSDSDVSAMIPSSPLAAKRAKPRSQGDAGSVKKKKKKDGKRVEELKANGDAGRKGPTWVTRTPVAG